MEKKYTILAVIGKSGSGKDTLVNEVCKSFKRLNRIVTTTTRPVRENEKEGRDYYFVDEQTFADKVVKGDIIEASDFRGWFYGTEIRSLDIDSVNIGVFNPASVEALREDSRVHAVIFYVVSDDKTRLIRSLNREDSPDVKEIIRRFKADQEDFYDLPFNFIPVPNLGKTSLEEAASSFKNIILDSLN